MSTEFLKKLPGVDSNNIHRIIKNARTVTDLCRISEDDHKKILGPKNGKDLKAFLQRKVEVIKQQEGDEDIQ